MGVSGFSCARVKGVGRGSLGFSFPCLPCLGSVFGHAFVLLLVWIDGDRGCFRVPFVGWLGFHGLMCDPPSPLLYGMMPGWGQSVLAVYLMIIARVGAFLPQVGSPPGAPLRALSFLYVKFQ